MFLLLRGRRFRGLWLFDRFFFSTHFEIIHVALGLFTLEFRWTNRHYHAVVVGGREHFHAGVKTNSQKLFDHPRRRQSGRVLDVNVQKTDNPKIVLSNLRDCERHPLFQVLGHRPQRLEIYAGISRAQNATCKVGGYNFGDPFIFRERFQSTLYMASAIVQVPFCFLDPQAVVKGFLQVLLTLFIVHHRPFDFGIVPGNIRFHRLMNGAL
mmetsp:Transcript_4160/g.6481  ORF Transcript_4160/g.6481 Transcript_4160/m.6481 type:complete len:210 (-) Transcript_4160:298-927(-)